MILQRSLGSRDGSCVFYFSLAFVKLYRGDAVGSDTTCAVSKALFIHTSFASRGRVVDKHNISTSYEVLCGGWNGLCSTQTFQLR